MRIRSLGGEAPLKKGMATHCSILVWRILWAEEPADYISLHHRVGHDWSELAHMHTCSKDPNSQMIFKEKFYRQNLQGVLQDMWPSSDWLVVRSQGGVPGIYLLVPTTLGSSFLCSAWSYHAPPGWGLSSYRSSPWHALLCASLVEEAGHWPITTLLLISTCANWPK